MPPQPVTPTMSAPRYPPAEPQNQVAEGVQGEKLGKGELPLYASESQEKLVLGPAQDRTSRQSSAWARHFMGWKLILFGSWFNVLLVMLPVAWVTKLVLVESHALAFSLCILGLIPLVRLHDISIAELSIRVGGSKTGLLNASMSNFIEMVVAISALRKCELRVVQSSLVGSVLSKLLLVLGLCFFAGGMRFSEQGFDQTATQVHSSLLIISVGVLLLPAAYHFTLTVDGDAGDLQKKDILNMSHGVSVVMIFIYGSYLAFQLWSHSHLYSDHHNKKSERLQATQNISAEKAAAYIAAKSRSTFSPNKGKKKDRKTSITSYTTYPPTRTRYHMSSEQYQQRGAPLIGQTARSCSTSVLNDTDADSPLPTSEVPTVRLVGQGLNAGGVGGIEMMTIRGHSTPRTPSTLVSSSTSGDSLQGLGDTTLVISQSPREDPVDTPQNINIKPPKQPQISWFLTIFMLLSVTMCVSITADWIVESMDGISTHISKDWVALILLPTISSVAECITAMRVSVKDELSLSISVAVGSTIQTALFVIPFMVLLAWAVKKPLTLLMDPFQSLVLYISVQTTSYVIADGKSNWLEGVILFSLYVIIAVAFWFYPGSVPLDFLVACPREAQM